MCVYVWRRRKDFSGYFPNIIVGILELQADVLRKIKNSVRYKIFALS